MTSSAIALTDLSDDQLLTEVQRLANAERGATVALIRSLMELDARRLYLREGCASLFTYCTQVLHLAEGSAYNRIEMARAARRFPEILAGLADGSLTMTAVRLLAPHLTDENHRDVLASAQHKSKRDVELLVAISRGGSEMSPAAGSSMLHLAISRETQEKLRHARDLLRHSIPNGDAAQIFDRALTSLIADLERRRCARVSSPRAARQANRRSRHIPAAVRREVWRRDQAQCAFVGTQGRCSERGFLEIHHVQPYADGGTATVENLQLRCRAHNAHEASLWSGDGGADLVRESPLEWS